jgi:hypothetical protein
MLPLARGVALENTVGRDDFGADDVVAIDISADKKIVGRRSGRETPQHQKAEEDKSWGFSVHEKKKRNGAEK